MADLCFTIVCRNDNQQFPVVFHFGNYPSNQTNLSRLFFNSKLIPLDRPLVSVVLLTHNHGAYIEQCLKSVVSQKTDFPFEIIIGEDGSTDETRSICQKFEHDYPGLIRLNAPHENYGLGKNLIDTLSLAEGQFIAFQEGDDYWTSENKLQLQVNQLMANPGFSACTHNTGVMDNNRDIPLIKKSKPVYTLDDAARGRIFHTNSWMIRKEALPDFKNYYDHLVCWDLFMEIKVLEHGPVYCLDASLSVWRKHAGGNSVKIPLLQQYESFRKLYLRMSGDAKAGKNLRMQQVMKQIFRNFYREFSFELARRNHRLYPSVILKSIWHGLKSGKPDLFFLPRLLITYFKAHPR